MSNETCWVPKVFCPFISTLSQACLLHVLRIQNETHKETWNRIANQLPPKKDKVHYQNIRFGRSGHFTLMGLIVPIILWLRLHTSIWLKIVVA